MSGHKMTATKWDQRFVDLARHVAGWSQDPTTKVGAVIVNDMNLVVGLGFNGFPRGVEDDPVRYADRETKYALIVHSEINAVLNATQSVRGCEMFTTKYPCSACVKMIIQSGITTVYSPKPGGQPVWIADSKHSELMMNEAGVTWIEYDE